MTISAKLRGDDLEAAARRIASAVRQAGPVATRKTAHDTAKALRRQVKAAFKGASPISGERRFDKTIRVKRMGKGWYRVYSKATYRKGRTMQVDLLWVFDTAPVVRARGGKATAIPLSYGTGMRNGSAPMAPNGRRFATPREATAMGWDLEFRPLRNGRGWLVVGRLAGGDFGKMYGGSAQRFEPLYLLMKGGTKMPKRVDLDGLMRTQGVKLDAAALDELDMSFGRARRVRSR